MAASATKQMDYSKRSSRLLGEALEHAETNKPMSNEEWIKRWRALMLFHYGRNFERFTIRDDWAAEQQRKYVTPAKAVKECARAWRYERIQKHAS